MDATPQTRRFRLTPARFVIGLLVVEGLLWLSDRFGWLGWHKGYAVLTAVASVGVATLVMLGWFGVALVFGRRFQFSIRSLLVLVVVVALPCSWLAVEMKKASEQKEAVETVETCCWDVLPDDGPRQVTYDYEVDCKIGSGTFYLYYPEMPGPNWLRDLLGKDFFTHVVELHLSDSQFPDANLRCLAGFSHLQDLDLSRTLVADEGVQNLTGLLELERLYLTDTKITDAGVAKLQQALPNCKITR